MSMSKRKPKTAPVENLELDTGEEGTPQLQNRMDDLPPEVLTIILEYAILNATRNKALQGYRLVNRRWKEIIDTFIEKLIVSGDFKLFQGPIKIIGRRPQCDQLHVQTGFRAGETPFLFNSLFLHGIRTRKERFNADRPATLMTLPVFASTFGGNVTSFSLHNQVIPITTLATLLGSMPGLKLLRLRDVKQNDALLRYVVCLPTPPALPNLTTLEMKSRPGSSHNEMKNEMKTILYVWLIASYADQLVSLELDTQDPLPALQKRHQYSVRVSQTKALFIATTSDAAFGNLKRLKLSRAKKDFLTYSETPALQQLSVSGVYYYNHADMPPLHRFVLQCGSTLEKLSLDVTWVWKDPVNFEQPMEIQPRAPQSAGVVVPKLKVLATHYPSDDFQERILREVLLVLFPTLETLYFLRFPTYHIATDEEVDALDEIERTGNFPDQIVAVKTQLALLKQEWHEKEMDFRRRQRNILLIREPDEPIRELRQEMSNARFAATQKKAEIFEELEALGVKVQDVVVGQFLERQGIWTTCPNLKMVSVSSGGKPEGDVCVIRRTNDA